MADRQTDDFKLGNKAADMWLYTADACANEKVIPKKYRYTTGTALMRGCSAAIAAFHWGIACSRRQLGPALPELE